MSNKEINFTKKNLENLFIPEKGRDVYKDTGEKGLSLYVTSNGVKTFFLRKRIEGKDEKIIIGNFPDLSVQNARDEFIKIRSMIAKGMNPNDIKRASREEYTLGQFFEEYMRRYSKVYKKSWEYDEREIPKFLSHWFHRKLSKITTPEIRKLHEDIRADNGLYQANRMLERIRAMYNKAIEWEYAKTNPSNGIKKYREKKRDRFIMPNEIKAFFESLEMEESDVAKDYFKILLFTGARKTNVLAMRWEEIDFDRNIWRIPETKNGDFQDVSLITYAVEILKDRFRKRESEWVFPSKSSKEGYFKDPKKAWSRILKRAGIENLRIHDLRRTLGSYQAITGASLSIIGKSLGHKSMDSTQIYARLYDDPIRDSMENAISKMLSYKVDKDE
ncbi:MAG: site-specific integrase [Alphaproteobacteria bacterium]|jgi:integrase|nr:site-specific integrase [Alphaproteobacteria bacterium]